MDVNSSPNQTIPPQIVTSKNMSFFNKNKTFIIGGIIILILIIVIIIHHYYKNQNSISNGTSTQTQQQQGLANNPTHTVNTSQAIRFDCTASNSSCPELTIQGDPPSTLPDGSLSQFRGYADPSMRKDLLSNRIWLSYSWPNIHSANGTPVPAVDIHLAYSDDNGNTWHYQGPLWPSTPDINKAGDSAPGYTVHETSNILPVMSGTDEIWYGARWTYFVPQNGGYKKLDPSSFRLEISEASTPEGLATAGTIVLGGNGTSSAWGKIDVNLSSLSSEISNCDPTMEPALYDANNTLYLMTWCRMTGIAVFSTQPNGDIHSWQWHYKGLLMKSADAAQLGIGAQGFTQGELAKSKDGKLLAILSPYELGTGNPGEGAAFNHSGCWVFQVADLNSPSLVKDSSGNFKVLASITASDLGTQGPGSCTYDPNSSTGLLIARRQLNQIPKTTTINETGVKF